MKQFYLLLIAILGISSFVYSQAPSPGTTVYIIRHAEKDVSVPENPDPELSMEGRERNYGKSHHTSVIQK